MKIRGERERKEAGCLWRKEEGEKKREQVKPTKVDGARVSPAVLTGAV